MDVQVFFWVNLGLFLLLLACYGWGQPRMTLAIENWSHTVKGFDEAPDLFYARLYQRLKEALTEAQLPDATIGFGSRHLFGNRTIFGARPQYLMVRYTHLSFYIYAFPLPGGLYVSYCAFSKYTLWEDHPIIKLLLAWRNYHMTIYQYDVTDMCLGLIRGSLHQVIDSYCAERGLKPLEEYERRPVLHSFYARYKQAGASGPSTVPMAGMVLPVSTAMPAGAGSPSPVASGAEA